MHQGPGSCAHTQCYFFQDWEKCAEPGRPRPRYHLDAHTDYHQLLRGRLFSRYGPVTGPLQARYGPVTGPLHSLPLSNPPPLGAKNPRFRGRKVRGGFAPFFENFWDGNFGPSWGYLPWKKCVFWRDWIPNFKIHTPENFLVTFCTSPRYPL